MFKPTQTSTNLCKTKNQDIHKTCMKKIFYILLLSISANLGLISCSDGSVGSSISQSTIEIAMDSSFTISGATSQNSKVISRTINQLLGVIKANNYGELRSDLVTQFMPSFKLDTTGVTINDIDSVKLNFRINNGGFTGDSLTPMRVTVYRLNKQLPSPIYSNFDPKDYYNPSDIMGSVSYTASALGKTDSINELTYREVSVKLPLSFGKDIFKQYKENSSIFASPSAFAQYFPGIYATTTYGSGRVMNIFNTEVDVYYRQTVALTEDSDTTYFLTGTYLATTPEIVTNSNISLNIDKSIKSRVDNGESIIQAPAGLDVAVKFPAQEIIDKYLTKDKNLRILNSVYFEIPAEAITNDFGIKPPPYLLLIKSSKKDEFFEKSSITDNISSFYAAYNSTTKKYVFSDMRNYVLDIINNSDGIAKDEDSEFTITPVTVTTETNSYTSTVTVTSISPYVEGPAVVKLNPDKAKIRLTYSKEVMNF